ncbi:hypothetical protein DBT_1433 [Dissulfuribacter thermophilus]|uniref:Permease YjgP/YjgQ family protein n=1 Tax=Dissulfuribacter thermophilus TaxID=1156395 RepID=A0A1B9F5Y0_9BACT|nr:LptF/LptG family permease [Dissulfuribacter thermophilus]OCC15310.1 hypothetical protein DBT_1433 [Dissulfuribacter thermophilus]
MKLLKKYILKAYFQFFGLVLLSLSGVYIIVEVFEKMDEFIEQDVSIFNTTAYFIMRIPQILFDLFPMSILLAGVLYLSLLIRNKEYVAMRAVGISPGKIIGVPVVASLALCVVVVLFQGFIVGSANHKAMAIWNQEVEKIPSFGSSTGTYFFRGKGSIWAFEKMIGEKGFNTVNVILFEDDYSCKRVIRAQTARFAGKHWEFFNGIAEDCSNKQLIDAQPFKQMKLFLEDKPGDFSRMSLKPKAMGIFELASTIIALREIGIRDKEMEAVFWNRLFYPFFGVTLLLLGLRTMVLTEGGGIGLGIVIGLTLSFSGWALWNLFCSWGETGRISPVLPPIILIVGFFMLSYSIEQIYERMSRSRGLPGTLKG